MARLFLRAYLVNNTIHPEYEISPQNLIEAFVGDDTGAPLSAACFYLETDDGHRVDITIPAPGRKDGQMQRATEMEAKVYQNDSDPGVLKSLKTHCLEPPDHPIREIR